MSIAQWLVHGWPWWLQALAAAALALPVLGLCMRFFGWQAAIRLAVPAAALLAAFAGLRRARQQGWSDHAEKERRDAGIAMDAARAARADSERADPRRLRDDDGFRRS
ncbi:MAG: hypothetical protein H2042_11465 [Rhizobiales bacterium]|nr:hypothetical protein [Hyphomicrobiales bacterium]